MSKVRVLVGTNKGAFVALTPRTATRKLGCKRAAFCRLGDLSKALPPSRIAFTRRRPADGLGRNPALQRRRQDVAPARNPAGETPAPGPPKSASNKFAYDSAGAPLTTHQWYDGTQHPWEFKRVWHVEPSLTDPDTVYAGVEDAAIFRSTDGGENWKELSGSARTRHRP